MGLNALHNQRVTVAKAFGHHTFGGIHAWHLICSCLASYLLAFSRWRLRHNDRLRLLSDALAFMGAAARLHQPEGAYDVLTSGLIWLHHKAVDGSKTHHHAR